MAKKMSSRSRSRRNRSQQKTRNQRRTRNQRKQSRRNHKRSHNHNQRGGMAEWSSAGDYTLIGPDARVSAQVGPLDSAFGELPSVIPQRGGRSHSRNRSRKARRALSRKRNHSRRHNQKGGMAPFGDTGRTLTASQYAADGTNPQFRTEVNVNERYAGF